MMIILRRWIGGVPGATGGANSSQSSQHPSPALKPRGSKDTDTSQKMTDSRDLIPMMPSCPPEIGQMSSSVSTSTAHTSSTKSTSPCVDLAIVHATSKGYITGTRSLTPPQEDTHNDRLLNKPHLPEDLLFPPDISYDSSPLAPRKGQFTIVPCSEEDPLDPKMSKRRGK